MLCSLCISKAFVSSRRCDTLVVSFPQQSAVVSPQIRITAAMLPEAAIQLACLLQYWVIRGKDQAPMIRVPHPDDITLL